MYQLRLKIHNLIKPLAILAGLLFMVVSMTSIRMDMGKGSNIPGCMFVRDSKTMCPMNITKHLATWQSTFVSSPAVQIASIVTLLLGLGFVSWFLMRHTNSNFLFLRYSHRYRQKTPEGKLFDYLQIVLSQGILQPLVYA